MPSPFVYINGYPGVGKLSTARELSKMIENSKILHNHLLIDPVAAIYERTMPEYQPLRAAVRNAVLQSIATSNAKDVTWIFTDQQSSSLQGSSAAQDYYRASKKRGSQFVSIILHCSVEENLRRLTMEGRGGQKNSKLTDQSILHTIRGSEDIYHFGGQDEMELDVSSLTVKESAASVYEFFSRVTSSEKGIASQNQPVMSFDTITGF